MLPRKVDRAGAERVLEQMKQLGLSFWDEDEEYFHGTSLRFCCSKERSCFLESRADVIVGSFFTKEAISRERLIDELMQRASLHALRKQGFGP